LAQAKKSKRSFNIVKDIYVEQNGFLYLRLSLKLKREKAIHITRGWCQACGSLRNG